jgi:hypothetical protein
VKRWRVGKIFSEGKRNSYQEGSIFTGNEHRDLKFTS